MGDLGNKVPDECCEISSWPEAAKVTLDEPMSSIHNGVPHNCFLQDINTEMQGRIYLGCEDGVLIGGGICVPDGVTYGAAPGGYPMNHTFAATTWQNGTYESCGCGNRSNLKYPAKFVGGAGCYVAATGIMMGHTDAKPESKFTRIYGRCTYAAEYLI